MFLIHTPKMQKKETHMKYKLLYYHRSNLSLPIYIFHNKQDENTDVVYVCFYHERGKDVSNKNENKRQKERWLIVHM